MSTPTAWDDYPIAKSEVSSWDDFPLVEEKKDRPFLDISDTGSALVDAVGGLGTTVPSAFRQLSEGMSNPWKRSPEYQKTRENLKAYLARMEQADADAAASGDSSSVSAAIRSTGPSLGFSVGAMGSGLVGSTAASTTGRAIGSLAGPKGAVVGDIVGRAGGGLAAGYGAAYRMAGAQFLDDARDELDNLFQKKLGRPLTEQEQEEAYAELKPLAEAFGHAEAGPEAIGNMAMAGAGKFVFSLGKDVVKSLAKNALTRGAATVAGLGTELAGETATTVEQNRITQQKDAVLAGKEASEANLPDRTWDDYVKAFEEVAPATLATAGILSGVAATAKAGSMLLPSKEEAEAGPSVTEAIPLPDGTVINKGAPAVITPEFLEGLSEQDMAEAEKLGYITRPPIVMAPVDASPVEQAMIEDADASLKAAGDLAPATVAAMQEDQALTGDITEEVSPVATETLTQQAADQEALGEGSQLQSAEEGSIPSVTADIIDAEAQESSPEIEPAQPDETVLQQPEPAAISGEAQDGVGVEEAAPETSGAEPSQIVDSVEQQEDVRPVNTDRFTSKKEAEKYIGRLLETIKASEKMMQVVEETGIPLNNLYKASKLGPNWVVAKTPEHESAAKARNTPPIEQRREEVIQKAEAMPLQTRGFAEGDPVAVKVAGKEVIGTVAKVNPDDTADVDYSWNGEDYAHVQSLLRKIRRPAHSLTETPSYSYTQEQNTRKAQRFGLPTEAGITIDAGPLISTVLRNIAKDTATSPMLRAAARALGNTSFDKVDLRIDADGRRKYAGYYLSDEGISEIGVNLRQVARGNVDAIGTLVHEALHHATLAKVRDPQPGIEQESVEALNQIIKRIRAYAAAQEKGKKFDYETSNVEEFISALFTRPDFQDFLASIPDTFSPKTGAAKFRSVLSEIFRIIAQIVTGQRVQKGSTMEQALASTIVLFDTPQRTIDTSVASPAKSPMTVYRAGDADEKGVKPFSSWTPDESTARIYQDNPGYGGEKLRSAQVDAGNILKVDTTTPGGMRRLAESLGYDSELGNVWWENGWRYPWEESSNVKRALEESPFDAVEYVEDYPAGATTIIFIKEPKVFSRAEEELSQAAAVASGQAPVTTPKGLSSLMRPSASTGIPATGPRGLDKLFATKPQRIAQASIAEAYKQAAVGKSSQMVPIRDAYEKMGGTMTPEQFVAQVEAEYNAGRVLLEMPEQASTQQDAGVFVVPMSIGPKATSMMVVPESTQFSTTNDPEVMTPMEYADAYNALVRRFGKDVADKLRVGKFGPVANAEWDGLLHNGEIGLNLRFIPDEKTLILKAEHEMAHAVWQDPSVRQAWSDLRASMPQDVQERLQADIQEMGYDPSKIDQETLVRYLEDVRANTSPSAWQAFWDAVINAFRRLFGMDPDERTARVVAARIVAAGGAAVARGLPQDASMFEQSRVDSNLVRETQSRFAPPNEEDRKYAVLTQEENDRQAKAWIDSLGTKMAADLALKGMFPKGMETSIKENIVGTLLVDLTQMSTNTELSEDERTVATAQAVELGKFWVKAISQDPARALQQRAVQNARLFPFAPILEAETILTDRAEKIVKERFIGGADAVVNRINDVATQTSLDADERVERILQTLIGSLGPKETATGALAKMFRGKGQRDQVIDEVAQALMLKSRGNTVAPERKTALAQLVASLKSTLSAQVKGEKVAAPDATLPDLLTRAFVNQVAEGELFTKSWNEGRQRVLDMLIGLEMDKTYYPLEKNLKDTQARLTHLEAGNEQQIADSAAERATLKQQITDIKASMDAEKKAIAEMVDAVLVPQRDALMPASVPMAFDPAASKGALTRAFEQAGYTAELATGLDKSGKRTLSMKDAVRDKKRAVAAVMNVFDEAMKPLDAATQNEWQKAIPVAQKAVEDTLAQWQKDLDTAATKKLELQKEGLLDADSNALEKLVNSLKAKISPDTKWADIFYDLPENQDARKGALLDRLSKHEALRNLTPDEQEQLAENVNSIWQKQRQKLFKKELKKAGVLGEKSLLDRAKVFEAAPRLLRFLNLGVFTASAFREAIAKEYGLRLLTTDQANSLRKKASEAWNEPEGILRNRKLRELLGEIQTVTKAPWAEIINSYWTASVLSGLRTQFDTYMAVLNGFGTNLIQAGTLLARGKGQAAVDAHLQWWQGLVQGTKESLLILAKGDTSYLKRFSEDVKKATEGESGFSPVPTGERLWKEGNMAQKWLLAPVMLFTGRLMTAADHINNTATTQGAMAVARALHPDIYGGKAGFTSQETADARKQAIREALGGKDPATYAERRIVDARTREILNGGLTDADRLAASETGDIAAFQNDPTGFFGAVYSAIKSGLGSLTRAANERAEDEKASAITRAVCATFAGTLHALTGTRFMRFGFNFGNDIIRYVPGSYLLDKLGFFGKETSQQQRDLLLGKNIVGLILGSTLAAMFDDDDEEKDGEWHIEGDWTAWSREDQTKRRSAGLEPGTMWKREKDGTVTRVRYMQWPTMGLFAAVGGMQDQRRAKPADWAATGTAGHLLNAGMIGVFQVQNVSAMRGLAEIFGGANSASGRNTSALKDMVVNLGVNYAGGLTPTLLDDVDVWHKPENYKAEGVMEQLMRGMPIARRYVNDGRPQLTLLGDPVELNRAPWSRTGSQVKLEPAYVTLGHLLARGHDLQMPNATRQIFKDGKKVPLETLGRDVAWEYEKAVGDGYKQWLTTDGEKLMAMPVEQADKVIDKRSALIRDVALKQIQAWVNRK